MRRSLQAQAGFTIVESLIALGLVFVVVVGLLATVNVGIRGVITGRQRSVALSIANEVIETARSRSYTDVGHDLDSDPTLATDTAISGAVPNLLYANPAPAPPEALVGSVVDAGAAAGATTNPLFPFSPHRWPTLREATTYTTSVYVTRVVPTSGDPYRRLTVIVTWDKSLDAPSAIPATVRLSSFMFNATQPPDPLFTGLADADAGTVTVVNRSPSGNLSDARLWLPTAHGDIDSRFVRRATGFAGTARSATNLRSGSLSGCTVSNGGLTAECAGVKAETVADNDAATAPPDHNPLGPIANPGGTSTAAATLTSALGAGTARSLSTARSCWSCYGAGADDDDRLPYQWAEATGPAALSMPFSAGLTTGSLVTAGTGCATCSTVTLDRDELGGQQQLATTAAVAQPAIDVVTLAGVGALLGYAGMVRVGPTTVRTSATSGPAALPPSFIAAPVIVKVYDTSVLPGYKTVTITPGTPSETTSHAVVLAGAGLAVMDATIRSGPAVTLSTTIPGGGALSEAQASLSNWLTISVHLVITVAALPVADLDITLDYGRVTARATYQPAPAA